MKKISFLTEDLKKKILSSLYNDEIYNVVLIELIQNNTDMLGELYVNKFKEEITDILHIKNDGNSNFTNFLYTSDNGLKDIGNIIKELNYKKVLLAGKLEAVNDLLKVLEYKKSIIPNIFYKLNIEKYRKIEMQNQGKIRLANLSSEDLQTVKCFTVRFLEAKTEEEIKSVTNTEKILAKIKLGIYLLDYKGKTIGMARFIGKTNNFVEITSIYIDKPYRKMGLGKELIRHIIEIAISDQKTPILVTSIRNNVAIKTYESMGFERQEKYAYEFLD